MNLNPINPGLCENLLTLGGTCPLGLGHGRVSKGGLSITLKPKNPIQGPVDVSGTSCKCRVKTRFDNSEWKYVDIGHRGNLKTCIIFFFFQCYVTISQFDLPTYLPSGNKS